MEVTTVEEFAGFTDPTRYNIGFTQLPHELIDLFPEIETVAELKVILYVLRHTWGFQEFDTWRRLTIDDFMYGRMTRNGRMDRGTGLSKASVLAGLERAIEHGYLLCKIDDRDLARIRKRYKLKLSDV